MLKLREKKTDSCLLKKDVLMNSNGFIEFSDEFEIYLRLEVIKQIDSKINTMDFFLNERVTVIFYLNFLGFIID